jgi:tetratricopeptide (TPR) repeat protein
VFEVQDEIAGEVVAALKLELLPEQSVMAEKPTQDLEAYSLFLRARAQRKQGNTDAYRKAIATYREAIARDGGFARAWSGLADAQAFLADSTADLALHQAALASIDKAVELAPDDPEVLASRALILSIFKWDWEAARQDAERALALDPNNVSAMSSMAWLLAMHGRVEQAQGYADRAYALDPLSFGGAFSRGLFYNSLGRPAESVPVMDLILADQPDNSMARILRNTSLVLMEQPERALADPGEPGSSAALYTLALAGKAVGRDAEAMSALEQLERQSGMGMAYQIAEVHAWRGDTDQAFAWLDRALEQRDGGMAMLSYDPLLRTLHDDPRFAALKAEMGLSE